MTINNMSELIIELDNMNMTDIYEKYVYNGTAEFYGDNDEYDYRIVFPNGLILETDTYSGYEYSFDGGGGAYIEKNVVEEDVVLYFRGMSRWYNYEDFCMAI